MKNLLNLILILGLALILTGCPPKETTPPEADGSKASMTLDDLDDEGDLTDEERAEDENAKDSVEKRKKLIKELAVKDLAEKNRMKRCLISSRENCTTSFAIPKLETKQLKLTIGALSLRTVVLRVQVWASWVHICW